ncbi:L,D-transpeptidase [Nocardia sp. XZ_19_385]|uniref:L,D-transpeptidase n=1 Tax=Nocardia sp. XZ_19_385 TaxID=2769488 RepID=UPI0018907E53|nr:L,D-transpeptidase [Nocardia sp. XZ_19_385]
MRSALRSLFLALSFLALTVLGVPSAVQAAPTEFRTSAGTFADGDMSNHTFTVTVGGIPRTMNASYGKPGYETPAGTYPVMSKHRSIVFDSATIGIPKGSSEYYYINGEWALRLTSGGVFIHSAPWSVDSQGYANVSHGCLNLSPEDAQWVYNVLDVGDPVTLHW